jgi:hypothetical protein
MQRHGEGVDVEKEKLDELLSLWGYRGSVERCVVPMTGLT